MALTSRASRPLSLFAGVAILAAACSAGGGAGTSAPATQPAAPSPSASAMASPSAAASPSAGASQSTGTGGIALASSTLGTIVVDGTGRTLYLFTKDTQGDGKSVCYDQCEASWPPLLADAGAAPAPADGVTGELGTITRTDGTTQVTLNGWPLYYFAGDRAAGDVNGQGLNGVWWVVSAAGDAVESAASGPDDYGPGSTGY